MKTISRRIAFNRQRGSAAVEAAVIIPLILVPLLAFVLLFGRYFWYYTVAQKAVHDASLYLASAPLADIRNNAAVALAQQIIEGETADMDQSTTSTRAISAICFFKIPANSPNVTQFPCATVATLAEVRTSLSMTVTDPFLAPITNPIWGSDGITIMTGMTLRYVGR